MVSDKMLYIKDIKVVIKSITILLMMIIIGVFWLGVHKSLSSWLMEIFFPVIPVLEESNFLSRMYGHFWE